MRDLPKLEIRCPNATGAQGKVLLDGKEIPYLKRLALHIGVDEFNTVNLEVVVGQVDVVCDRLVKASVEVQKPSKVV